MARNRIISIILIMLMMDWAYTTAQVQKPVTIIPAKPSKKELKQQRKASKEALKREKRKKLMLLKPGEVATVIKKDTAEVEDNPFLIMVGEKREAIDSVRLRGEVNPDTFILDRRYRNWGDTLHSHWYDNLSLQLGAGAEQMISPVEDYRFDMLTTANLGIGMQLGKFHTVRLMLQAALGYQQFYDRMFARVGGRLDHMFDVSSYFNGYNPARLMGVQTILGIGGHYAKLNRMNGQEGKSFEAHGGLQLNFYTGPRGSFSVEPYFGLATDDYDLSLQRNWRKIDMFYGVNLNYVYYFSNHLTRAARFRLIDKAKDSRDMLIADSILQSWQSPWFFEVAAGPSFVPSPQLSSSHTMGHEITMGVGKWFSPVIGVRLSGEARSGHWQNIYSRATDGVTYERAMYTQYVGGRIEAMFNPFGFKRDYIWDSRLGAYFVGGLGFGKFVKYEKPSTLNCFSEEYVAGLHLWARLTDGLQLFVEPRLAHNVYKIPYRNVSWNHRYADNTYGVNIGLTAVGLGRRYRQRIAQSEESEQFNWTVGLGGGMNLVHIQDRYLGDKHSGINFGAFGQYQFSRVSSVRLGLEYMMISLSDYTQFVDRNMLASNPSNTAVLRNGQWSHTYYLGMASLDYSMNLGNLIRGYQPRRFEMDVFYGPAVVFTFGETGQLSERELLRNGHEASLMSAVKQKTYLGAHGGVKFVAHVSNQIGITLTPQLFYVPKIELQAVHLNSLKLFETLDLGVQYKF